jgi:hypothetical protein
MERRGFARKDRPNVCTLERSNVGTPLTARLALESMPLSACVGAGFGPSPRISQRGALSPAFLFALSVSSRSGDLQVGLPAACPQQADKQGRHCCALSCATNHRTPAGTRILRLTPTSHNAKISHADREPEDDSGSGREARRMERLSKRLVQDREKRGLEKLC